MSQQCVPLFFDYNSKKYKGCVQQISLSGISYKRTLIFFFQNFIMRQIPSLKQISLALDKCREEKITIDTIMVKMGIPGTIFINWNDQEKCGLQFNTATQSIKKVYPDID